jgi:hypothetical protein
VVVTSFGAQSQKKQNDVWLGEGLRKEEMPQVRGCHGSGDGVTSVQMGLFLQPFSPQQTFLKPLLCATCSMVQGRQRGDEVRVGCLL